MKHEKWLPYSSGELHEGDTIQLGIMAGTIRLHKCPMCYRLVSKDIRQCRCGASFVRVMGGYKLIEVGHGRGSGVHTARSKG